MTSGRSKLRRSLAVLGVAAMVPLAFAAQATAADPKGDNGTIKIDGVLFDSAPDNQPHVGCIFQLDFYGFDQGTTNNFQAVVKFVAQPPTGRDVLLDDDKVFIGEDAAGGGTDLDAERTYDLSPYLQDFMAHPQQGYHIKVTVKAPGSIGADTKYKTFWVQNCNTPS